MSDDPALFCVLAGTGFAVLGVALEPLDFASAVASWVMGVVLAVTGYMMIYLEHRKNRAKGPR